MIDDFEELHHVPRDFKRVMEEVFRLDKECVPLKQEIESLKKSLKEKLDTEEILLSEKLQEKKTGNQKKRKRGKSSKAPRHRKKKKSSKEPGLKPEVKKIFVDMQQKHETHVGKAKQRLDKAYEVNKIVQASIDKLDKKLIDATREIRRTVHNNTTRLPKPTSYEILESTLQSELHIEDMRKQYSEFSFLEKQDVIIHLRSIGKHDESRVSIWERKIKRLSNHLIMKNAKKKIRRSLVRNNHDRKNWCFCNQKSSGQMIACDSSDCEIQWFHFVCVGLKVKPAGSWLCPRCVSKGKSSSGLPLRRKQPKGAS